MGNTDGVSMDDAKLVVVGGDTHFEEVVLRFPAVIGRGKDCDIVLRHPLVSRSHCEISATEAGLRVRDLGSLNGTFVGRERVTESDLRPGELLTIGTVTFRAVYANWTEDDSDVLAEVDKPVESLDTAELSADQTKHDAGKEHGQSAAEGTVYAPKVGDRVETSSRH